MIKKSWYNFLVVAEMYYYTTCTGTYKQTYSYEWKTKGKIYLYVCFSTHIFLLIDLRVHVPSYFAVCRDQEISVNLLWMSLKNGWRKVRTLQGFALCQFITKVYTYRWLLNSDNCLNLYPDKSYKLFPLLLLLMKCEWLVLSPVWFIILTDNFFLIVM